MPEAGGCVPWHYETMQGLATEGVDDAHGVGRHSELAPMKLNLKAGMGHRILEQNTNFHSNAFITATGTQIFGKLS